MPSGSLSILLAAQRLARRGCGGWTRAELATAAGLPRQTIYRIERGERDHPLSIVAALARVFGCAPGDLLRPLRSRR